MSIICAYILHAYSTVYRPLEKQYQILAPGLQKVSQQKKTGFKCWFQGSKDLIRKNMEGGVTQFENLNAKKFGPNVGSQKNWVSKNLVPKKIGPRKIGPENLVPKKFGPKGSRNNECLKKIGSLI